MGGNQSNLPPRPMGFDQLCIVIRETDKLRIVLGTDHEISIIRQVIEETWPRGIQQEMFKLNGVHEFKLKGNPFSVATSSSDAIMSKENGRKCSTQTVSRWMEASSFQRLNKNN